MPLSLHLNRELGVPRKYLHSKLLFTSYCHLKQTIWQLTSKYESILLYMSSP